MNREVEKILIQSGIEKNEAKAETNLIITEVSGLKIEEILAGKEISNKAAEKIFDIAQKRARTRVPIQHLLGFAYFMGDKFCVNENVLIPRPETELLIRCTIRIVQEIVSAQEFQETINILDIGTGTGCIPIEISKALPNVPMELMGVDISTDALQVAIKNMESLGEQRRVVFRKSDIFKGIREIDKFDVIVSNPPYIPISAKESLQNEVKNFDPDLALFAKDEFGIEFYEKILTDAKTHLKACITKDKANNSFKKGYVLFELGFTNGISQARIVSKIALEKGFKTEFIEKDLTGIDRVICLSC